VNRITTDLLWRGKMKRLILAIAILALATPAIAGYTLRLPYTDSETALLQEWIQDDYKHPGNFYCTGLSDGDCFKKVVNAMIKEKYRAWKNQTPEVRAAKAAAIQAIEDSIEDLEPTGE
jgi:hypothetical protein